MLDIRRIRQNPQELEAALKARGKEAALETLLKQDEERRKLLGQTEEKKAQRNAANKQIGLARKNHSSETEIAAMTESMRSISDEIASLDAQIAALDTSIENSLLAIPNIPHSSVPFGTDEKANLQIRCWGKPRYFPWEPKSHREIGMDLEILSWESANVGGEMPVTAYHGMGARMERAIINFLLDTYSQYGYREISTLDPINCVSIDRKSPPAVLKDGSAADQISSAAPVSRLYCDRILEGSSFPLCNCKCSYSFRAEAGSTGFDSQSLLYRQSFRTVELFQIVRPEKSYAELERMTVSVEKALQLLGLPYRIAALCTGVLGFSASKTYAVEVWMPSENRYVPIASCSNNEDYQARRAGIRFRSAPKEKPQYAHTLTSNGIAVERVTAAIWENFQNEDGTVTVPEVLVPYMGAELIQKHL